MRRKSKEIADDFFEMMEKKHARKEELAKQKLEEK